MRSFTMPLMRFGPDGPVVQVKWFAVPDGTPVVPFAHAFASRVYDDDRRIDADDGSLGEIKGQPLVFGDGTDNRSFGYIAPAGPVDYWQQGVGPVWVPLDLDKQGVPFQCKGKRQAAGVAGGEAFAVGMTAEGGAYSTGYSDGFYACPCVVKEADLRKGQGG
jgi:hypothetical protein